MLEATSEALLLPEDEEEHGMMLSHQKAGASNYFSLKPLPWTFFLRTKRRVKRRRFDVCSRFLVCSKLFLLFGFLLSLISVLQAILHPSYQNPPEHYREFHQKVSGSSRPGRGNAHNAKIFIAANIVDERMIRGPWATALIELINILGEENVFVSIYENDGGNGTRDALWELRNKLLCNSSIVAGDHLPLTHLPTVMLPNGQQRVKRIAYLAEIRNRALRPLDPSYRPQKDTKGFRHTSIKFNRILFLNDVYFSPVDAAQLLFSTNIDSNGYARYRAACAVDFISPVKFYDTFVVRDAEGYSLGTPFFPWFSTARRAESRRDVLGETDAVRVRSCWGGMVAFEAFPFQRQKIATQHPLRFRYDPEPFWEAAECCLVFADMEEQLRTPEPGEGSGVFLNPYIRVAYTAKTWKWMRILWRYERALIGFQGLGKKTHYPIYNDRRLHDPGQRVKEAVWINDIEKSRNGSYQTIERNAAAGGFCGERKMFVMLNDVRAANENGGGKNWEEIAAP